MLNVGCGELTIEGEKHLSSTNFLGSKKWSADARL